MKATIVPWAITGIFILSIATMSANAQVTPADNIVAAPKIDAPTPKISNSYVRPNAWNRFSDYGVNAYGPYAIISAAAIAGVHQATNAPPEWRQGAEAYGKRFGSEYGMAATSATARYLLSEVTQEDSAYYPCERHGFMTRLRHAVISSVTARKGDDGHRVFSAPSIIAPYAGSMTAVYGWYPGRFGAKDALRMGSYNLLGSLAGNIISEFINPRQRLSRHASNKRAADTTRQSPVSSTHIVK